MRTRTWLAVIMVMVFAFVMMPWTSAGSSGRGNRKVPSGAVMFFDRSACPKGWRMFNDAQGRTVVGGTPDTTVGAALADGEDRTHQHIWSDYEYARPGGGDWYSYDSTGARVIVTNWHDGIDGDGSGVYPLARVAPHQSESFYTNEASTSGVMPYVQLLPCVKK